MVDGQSADGKHDVTEDAGHNGWTEGKWHHFCRIILYAANGTIKKAGLLDYVVSYGFHWSTELALASAAGLST